MGTAAANGMNISPFSPPTTPIPAEFLEDTVVQLIQLIAAECVLVGGAGQAVASLNFTGSTSGTVVLQAPATGGGTLTLPPGTDTIAGIAATQTLTNKTLTRPTLTSPVITGPAPTLAGATLAVTAALAGQTILLNTAAGSVVTMPAATGSGNKYRFVVSTTTTSGAHKILAASVSDFIIGNAVGSTAAGATLKFSSTSASTNHALQMPFAGSQPSGGIIGDWFEYQDVAANLWEVAGMYTAGTTATTPFSATNS